MFSGAYCGGLSTDMRVVVYSEDAKEQFFGIDRIVVQKGNPWRGGDGKSKFEFKHDGETEWCFMDISPE
jgi:hypothetical protein